MEKREKLSGGHMKKVKTRKLSLILVIAVLISLFNSPFVRAESCYEVSYTKTADWGTGLVGSIEIVNKGDREIDRWKIEFDWNQCISSIWNAKIESWNDGHYIIYSEEWNKVISAGGKITFGFQFLNTYFK